MRSHLLAVYDVNKRVVQNETISLIFALSNYIVLFFFVLV